jgi:hypothetical protein
MEKSSIFFGFLLGFLPLFIIELIKNYTKRMEQRLFVINLLFSLTKEIEEGISRCKSLINMMEDNRISFSRIYISFWDMAKLTICTQIDDIELLGLLH